MRCGGRRFAASRLCGQSRTRAGHLRYARRLGRDGDGVCWRNFYVEALLVGLPPFIDLSQNRWHRLTRKTLPNQRSQKVILHIAVAASLRIAEIRFPRAIE